MQALSPDKFCRSTAVFYYKTQADVVIGPYIYNLEDIL